MEVAIWFLPIATVLLVVAFAVALALVNVQQLPLRLFPRLRARKKAREVGIQVCKERFPDEPIHGAEICGSKPDRYVVRIYYGDGYALSGPVKLPPWRDYLFVVVRKDTYVGEVIDDDGQYPLTIR